MAKNTDKDYRNGAVKNRSQCYNEKTNMFVKRDASTGRFLSAKEIPYKGIRKEKNIS